MLDDFSWFSWYIRKVCQKFKNCYFSELQYIKKINNFQNVYFWDFCPITGHFSQKQMNSRSLLNRIDEGQEK